MAQPSSWDEQTFVAEVLRSSPRLQGLRQEAALVEAEAVGVGAWENPSLGWEREGGTAQSQDQLSLSLPVALSGRRGLQQEAAQLRARSAQAGLEQQRWELELTAVRSFAAVRGAEERSRILTGSHQSLTRLAEAITARERAGDAAGYERLRIELEAAAVDGQQQQAVLERSLARAQAQSLLGTRPLPALHGELAAPRPLDTTVPEEQTLLDQRGDLRALGLEADAAGRAAQAAGRAWIPEPTLSGGLLRQESGGGSQLGYVAGISLPLPVFQRGQADEARASAQRALAQARGTTLLQTARAQLVAVAAEAGGRREQLGHHREQVLARATRLNQIAHAAYRGGAGDLLVLVDAERAWREARLREVELAVEVVAAETRWLALVGSAAQAVSR
ncbi:MAG: TolC family protein [Myxococcota bacterium]|nr:TolC family protein [Myxococcota bacterium]